MIKRLGIGIFIVGMLGTFMCKEVESMEYDAAEIYMDLRAKILNIDPQEINITKGKPNNVFGVLMETGYPEAVVTLVTIADGTVSLYFSNGGGIIGVGEYRKPREACNEFINFAPRFIQMFRRTKEYPLPTPGQTIFYFITLDGIYTAASSEDDLGNNRSALSPLFHKAQDVITQARIVDEKLRGDRKEGENQESDSAKQIIHYASIGDDAALIRVIKDGTDVNSMDSTGLTPLMAAAYKGATDSIHILVNNGANIESKDSAGYTALMFACNAGELKAVKMLIDKGADVNARDNDDSTPIMFAAQHGHNDIVRILLGNGSDSSVRGKHGMTAVDLANQNGHKETIKLINKK